MREHTKISLVYFLISCVCFVVGVGEFVVNKSRTDGIIWIILGVVFLCLTLIKKRK